jgi:post-segregation antitoxin (ccd killing protein)
LELFLNKYFIREEVAQVVENQGSERITVTVPRDLFNRLQEVKDGINISRVCQEGLAMAVKLEEIKNRKGDDTMKALAEKLKVQKKASQKQDKEAGFEAGHERALEFDYEDFKKLEEIAVAWKGWRGDLFQLVTSIIGPERFEELFWDTDRGAEFFTDGEAYLEGYIGGVMEVWRRVKGKI